MGVVLAALVATLHPVANANPRPPVSISPLGDGFDFGVSTSGFQSEGYNRDSNWLRYSNTGRTHDRVGNAVDFFHKYEEDIARAKSLGVSIYRTSVEWSRVQPTPGAFDPAGWAFYDRVVKAIVAAGMTPMITLNHWVHPGWEVDRGGWNRPGMADDLVVFARAAIDRYKWADPMWITFNEPTEYVRRELMYGGISLANVPAMADGIVRAHREIYRHAHAVQPGAEVSSNLAFLPIPGVQGATEAVFQKRMKGAMDFVGVDHYYSLSINDASVANGATDSFYKASQAPESIYYVLRYIAGQFPGLPIRIVENGLATNRTQPRPDGYTRGDHLRDTVYWIQRAAQDGIPVVSYNYWSLTDNYEWGSYASQFGLYSVNVKDPALPRVPTDAVEAYRRITSTGGVPTDYRPTREPVPCSLVAVPDSCTNPVTAR
ncbi:family 1 glycosylhydrolase [Gordonia sp. 'Campus']|uniref:family 1 glycosylhydrolase n=1 Tax=Gordonia sp. 'Campus' TaxID=2915824 RepID=UPI0035AF2260